MDDSLSVDIKKYLQGKVFFLGFDESYRKNENVKKMKASVLADASLYKCFLDPENSLAKMELVLAFDHPYLSIVGYVDEIEYGDKIYFSSFYGSENMGIFVNCVADERDKSERDSALLFYSVLNSCEDLESFMEDKIVMEVKSLKEFFVRVHEVDFFEGEELGVPTNLPVENFDDQEVESLSVETPNSNIIDSLRHVDLLDDLVDEGLHTIHYAEELLCYDCDSCGRKYSFCADFWAETLPCLGHFDIEKFEEMIKKILKTEVGKSMLIAGKCFYNMVLAGFTSGKIPFMTEKGVWMANKLLATRFEIEFFSRYTKVDLSLLVEKDRWCEYVCFFFGFDAKFRKYFVSDVFDSWNSFEMKPMIHADQYAGWLRDFVLLPRIDQFSSLWEFKVDRGEDGDSLDQLKFFSSVAEQLRSFWAGVDM